jgi:hypothetical protein
VRAGHAAPPGTLADGDMLVALAAELELDIPAPSELEASAMAPVSVSAHAFGDDSFRDGAELRPGEASGLRIAIAASVFGGGGTVRFDDAIRALRPAPSATFESATAARLGISAGDAVRITSAGGAELGDLVARVAEGALPNVVAVIDGLPGAPANGLRDGEAVSVECVRVLPEALVGGSV